MSSDSDLTSVVAELQFSNYVGLLIATTVVYDYIITLSKEINYIWNRSWTFVSAMFVIVRYVGLFVAVWKHLYPWTFPGTVLLIASDYAFTIFLAAADIVMMLRVYAMYDQSKIVLGSLLVFYIATIVLFTMSSAYYNNTNTVLTMTNPQVLGMSFCNPVYNIGSDIGKYKYIPRLTLAALMFVLAIGRLCKDAYRAYKATRTWETNRYIRLLVREGILYFFAHLFNTIDFGKDMAGIIVNAIVFSVMFVLSPRFIISVRETYAHSLLHVSGRSSGIDSGFGFSRGTSTPSSTVSSVGFAHSFVLRDENIEMQVRGKGTYV